MFLGDVPDQLAAKTAQGIVDWRRDWCLGQLRLPGCGADLGIPDMTIDAAAEAGAKTMIIGVANAGGVLARSLDGAHRRGDRGGAGRRQRPAYAAWLEAGDP